MRAWSSRAARVFPGVFEVHDYSLPVVVGWPAITVVAGKQDQNPVAVLAHPAGCSTADS
jgi:hypothetical protein